MYRQIDKKMFTKLVREFEANSKYSKKNPKVNRVSEVQVAALFGVLDLDGNGTLEHDEILGVLQERQMLGKGRQDELK